MRLLAGQLLIQLLVMLLVLTTPVGTGQGVHQTELLHPLFAHSHLIDGRIVTDEQLAAALATAHAERQPTAGPALGAAFGSEVGGDGLALGPTLPDTRLALVRGADRRMALLDEAAPAEFRDAPLEPPPDRA
jgi:hypothetical protein